MWCRSGQVGYGEPTLPYHGWTRDGHYVAEVEGRRDGAAEEVPVRLAAQAAGEHLVRQVAVHQQTARAGTRSPDLAYLVDDRVAHVVLRGDEDDAVHAGGPVQASEAHIRGHDAVRDFHSEPAAMLLKARRISCAHQVEQNIQIEAPSWCTS